MSNLTKNDILGLGIIAGFVATIGYAISCTQKLNAVSDRLNMTVKDIVDGVNIDIPETLINDAVKDAVNKEARYQVEKAANKAAGDVVKEYKSDIQTAVDEEFKLQKSELTKTLRKKIDDVDINEIKREVKIEAKNYVAEKLKKDLDDISDKYTDQIESMSNIYSTIASKIESIGD